MALPPVSCFQEHSISYSGLSTFQGLPDHGFCLTWSSKRHGILGHKKCTNPVMVRLTDVKPARCSLLVFFFPRPCGARKNTAQLAKYPRVLYVKPSNKMYLFFFEL